MKSYLPLVIAVVLLGLVQAMVGSAPYATYLATRVGIFVVLAVSLNIINGMTGQFSIGHAGFMAVGAYASTLLTLVLVQYRTPLPEVVTEQLFFVLSLLVGGVCAGLAGFLVGLPSLRLKGDYLAIVTLGFGEIIRVIVTNSKTAGGALGLSGIPARTSLFMVWLWVFVAVLLARRLAASSHGRALLAIREDEIAAEAMGVDTTAYKVRAFVVSSFFAGVAGGLFAHFLQAINPGNFTFVQSMEVVVMVVAGGLGSTTGAAVAAIFLVLLPEGLRTLFQSQVFMDALGSKDQSLAQKVDQIRMPIYGVLLVVIMLTRPQGIFGTHEVWDLFKRKQRAAPGGEAAA